jgi:uncharacterized UPF0146 family protein
MQDTDAIPANSDPFKRVALPSSRRLDNPTGSSFREFCQSATQKEFIGAIPELADLIKRTGADYWWMAADVRLAFEAQGLHVTQDTFYSPFLNSAQLTEHYNNLRDGLIPAAARLCDAERFHSKWREVCQFVREMADIPRQAAEGYYWDNAFFPNLDALTYHCIIRAQRPERVIEVGAGFSTHVAARALQMNGEGELQVIEPYPTPKLFELIGRRISLHQERVQQVPDRVFDVLRPGDVLFIDSSHVSKTGSDLNHIMFSVLPRLPRGILLHFHDIFLPYEYPSDWTLGRGWAWNEQYLLLAWLMSNSDRSPILGTHALVRHRRDSVAWDLDGMDIGPLSGGSFWVQ